jgi:hypothetical protein
MSVGIAHRCDDPAGVSVEVWAGVITLDDALEHVAALTAMPEWGAGGRILSDLSAMDSGSRPEPDELLELARRFEQQLAGRTRGAKWAVVANSAFEEAAQFGEYVQGDVRSLAVFFDLASACIWLGVPAEHISPVLKDLRQEALAAH